MGFEGGEEKEFVKNGEQGSGEGERGARRMRGGNGQATAEQW